MHSTHCTTSTRQSNPKVLHTSELPSLKENNPRYQFQKLADIIPMNVMNDLINQQSVRI